MTETDCEMFETLFDINATTVCLPPKVRDFNDISPQALKRGDGWVSGRRVAINPTSRSGREDANIGSHTFILISIAASGVATI